MYNYQNIIKAGLLINIAIYIYAFVIGYDRSFWIDELHVIAVSKKFLTFH